MVLYGFYAGFMEGLWGLRDFFLKKNLMNIEFRHLRHLKNRRMWLSTSGKTWKTIGKPTKYQVGIEFGNPIGMKIDDWGDWFEVCLNQTISKYTILRYPDVSGTSCSIWPILCGNLMMTSVGAFGFSCSLLFIVKVASEAPMFFHHFQWENVGLC